ncbi:efflux RND transporter periplasmic adaptor subunit [Sulfitobacter geojensis]|uniref:efflux RND transporter periplasmic adaptor subunit n=1 Tax=Sulfitobacter geojensis TaxID=1342299 RepID=UPI0024916203|nr:HlyD family efflux transporter periplasmic adaptor subunit [Sulfitobacter geojensis]
MTEAVPKPRGRDAAGKSMTAIQTFEDGLRGQATKQDLLYHIVNQLPEFLRAEQAVYGIQKGRRFKISEASAVADVNRESDYIQRLESRLHEALHAERTTRAFAVSLADTESGTTALPFGLALRLSARGRGPDRVLLLARGRPWKDPEIEMAAYLAGVYGHAFEAVVSRKSSFRKRIIPSFLRLAFVCALAALFLVQAKVSIIAPARVVPVDPITVTSGVSGRVSDVLVAQGDKVLEGETLFRLDDQIARDGLSAALQRQAVAIARQSVLLKQALTNPQARQELTVAEQEVKVAQIDVLEATHMLERHVIKAVRDGQVLSDNPDRLLGEIVEVGTQLVQLFDPDALALDVDIPVTDGLLAYRMTDARVFLNVDPLTPLELMLSDRPQTPRLDDRGGVSYPIQLQFKDAAAGLIVGMEGSAQISAPPKPLIYTLLRRPINWLRVRLPTL